MDVFNLLAVFGCFDGRVAEVVRRHKGPSPKNDAFVAKIVNTRLTKICMAIFAFDERLPTSATLVYSRSQLGEDL